MKTHLMFCIFLEQLLADLPELVHRGTPTPRQPYQHQLASISQSHKTCDIIVSKFNTTIKFEILSQRIRFKIDIDQTCFFFTFNVIIYKADMFIFVNKIKKTACVVLQ